MIQVHIHTLLTFYAFFFIVGCLTGWKFSGILFETATGQTRSQVVEDLIQLENDSLEDGELSYEYEHDETEHEGQLSFT